MIFGLSRRISSFLGPPSGLRSVVKAIFDLILNLPKHEVPLLRRATMQLKAYSSDFIVSSSIVIQVATLCSLCLESDSLGFRPRGHWICVIGSLWLTFSCGGEGYDNRTASEMQ